MGSMSVMHSVLNVKALVGAFNQEKALVGAFSVIINLCVDLAPFEALVAACVVVSRQALQAGRCLVWV